MILYTCLNNISFFGGMPTAFFDVRHRYASSSSNRRLRKFFVIHFIFLIIYIVTWLYTYHSLTKPYFLQKFFECLWYYLRKEAISSPTATISSNELLKSSIAVSSIVSPWPDAAASLSFSLTKFEGDDGVIWSRSN